MIYSTEGHEIILTEVICEHSSIFLLLELSGIFYTLVEFVLIAKVGHSFINGG